MAAPKTRLLLLSNSTAAGKSYLELWKETIVNFLNTSDVSTILFVPFAGVTIDWSDYTNKVQAALADYRVTGIHQLADKEMVGAIERAEVICVGGGNTFHLLHHLQKLNLLEAIKTRVLSHGVPYIGWSAGSNVATPDIGTTNDMPIIWPSSDAALGLVPFNINPHYNEWKPPLYNGEGRADRLNEAILLKKRPIVAISEGTGIRAEDSTYTVLCPHKNSPENPLMVKVWMPLLPNESKPKVIEVPLNEVENPLNPYLSQ